MTVGELVEAQAKIPGAADARGLSELFALYAIEVSSIIRKLGIWDAEVLEGQIIKGYDEDGEDMFGIAPLNGKFPYVWIGTHDEVVRIIALPKKGDE